MLTVFLFIASAIIVLSLASHWLAGFIPFSAERQLASSFKNRLPAGQSSSDSGRDIEVYLQNLADQLSEHMDLPDGMTVTLHYIDDDMVNAFATLGGNVFFFRGLLAQVPDENTLAMVMAHEIAHVKLRHPIKSLGRGIVVGTAVSIVSAAAGGEILNLVLGETGLLTALKFSREQEESADLEALVAVQRLYGHTQGATTLFDILLNNEKPDARPAEFFSSHPHSENRIETVNRQAAEQGWLLAGRLTPLPDNFDVWITKDGDD